MSLRTHTTPMKCFCGSKTGSKFALKIVPLGKFHSLVMAGYGGWETSRAACISKLATGVSLSSSLLPVSL
jgi:acid phosphatase family membrane protein YuiD